MLVWPLGRHEHPDKRGFIVVVMFFPLLSAFIEKHEIARIGDIIQPQGNKHWKTKKRNSPFARLQTTCYVEKKKKDL